MSESLERLARNHLRQDRLVRRFQLERPGKRQTGRDPRPFPRAPGALSA